MRGGQDGIRAAFSASSRTASAVWRIVPTLFSIFSVLIDAPADFALCSSLCITQHWTPTLPASGAEVALTREAGKNGKLATLLAEAGISSVEVRWEDGELQVEKDYGTTHTASRTL